MTAPASDRPVTGNVEVGDRAADRPFSCTTARTRTSRAVAVFSALLVCLGAVLVYWLLSPPAGALKAQDGLAVDPMALDFGEAWIQSEFHWTLPVRNVTSQDIEVLRVYKSCSCAALEPQSFILAPGESVDLSGTLDFTGSFSAEDSGYETPVTIELMPHIQPGRFRLGAPWRLSGRVRRPVVVSQAVVPLGEFLVGQEAPSAAIRVDCHPLVAGLATDYDPSLLSVEVRRIEARHDAFELDIRPVSSLPAGPFDFPVVLNCTDHSGREVPPMTVRAAGRVLDHVKPVPQNVVFGRVASGESRTQTVRLISLSDAAFSVHEVASDAAHVSVTPVPSVGGTQRSAAFEISVAPAEPGSHVARITFDVSGDFPGSPLQLVVPVSFVASR